MGGGGRFPGAGGAARALDRQYEDAANPNHPFIVAKIEHASRLSAKINNNPHRSRPVRLTGLPRVAYFVVDGLQLQRGVGAPRQDGGGDPASIRGVDLTRDERSAPRRQGEPRSRAPPVTAVAHQQRAFTMLMFAAPLGAGLLQRALRPVAHTFGRKTLLSENAPDAPPARVEVLRFTTARINHVGWSRTPSAVTTSHSPPNLQGASRPDHSRLDSRPEEASQGAWRPAAARSQL